MTSNTPQQPDRCRHVYVEPGVGGALYCGDCGAQPFSSNPALRDRPGPSLDRLVDNYARALAEYNDARRALLDEVNHEPGDYGTFVVHEQHSRIVNWRALDRDDVNIDDYVKPRTTLRVLVAGR